MTAPTDVLDGEDVEAAFGAYAVDFSLDDVPEAVREKATLVVLDTVGVCFYGSETDYVRSVASVAEAFGVAVGGDGATVFATGERSTPAFAALLNAASGTTLELDEGNQRSAHMGIHVVPPALAVAEHVGASGSDLLAAVITAYEVGARLGDVVRPMKEGLHPHGAWSPIGAAVATGRLLGFDAATMASTIRISLNPFVASTWVAAFEGATVRNYYTGIACEHGVRAALLAEAGITGVEDAAQRCLLPYTAASDIGDLLVERVASLGERYYLASSYFKMHAACRYSHPAVEALEAAIDGVDVDPADVERIDVGTFESGTWLDSTQPANVLAAKFSTPYVLAARLLLGTTGVEAFEESHLSEPCFEALIGRVELHRDEAYERAAQAGHWGATVTVELANGTTHTGAVKDAHGGGESPFSHEEVVGKFNDLAGAVLDDATWLRERLLDLESVDDVGTLFAD